MVQWESRFGAICTAHLAEAPDNADLLRGVKSRLAAWESSVASSGLCIRNLASDEVLRRMCPPYQEYRRQRLDYRWVELPHSAPYQVVTG